MGKWKLIYNIPTYSGYTVKVTAKCDKCDAPFWGNPREWMGNFDDTGTVIWSGFITNEDQYPDKAKQFALSTAKSNADNKMPKFCCNCGQKMEVNVEYDI